MSTDISNLAGALANSDMFKSLLEDNNKLIGSGGNDYKRISIKGGKFRLMVGGEQVNVSKDDNIDIVIVDASPISRTYYEGSYDPKAVTPPSCWSEDTKTPSDKVPASQKQSDKCATCPQSIKGSGQGDSRACRFSQRLAVTLTDDIATVYQLQLPATSLFGDAKGGNMPMQSYAKFLNANKAPAIAVVTNMYFDDEAETPKLFFKAVRPLTENELTSAIEAKNSDATKDALSMTVAESDGVKAKAKDTAEPVAEVKQKAKVKPEPEPEIEEPKKTVKKVTPEVDVDDDLSSLIDEWDD